MARHASKLTVVALATVLLSLLIISFPLGNTKEPSIETPRIDEARIMIEWGFLPNITTSTGTTMTGSTMSGTTLWDGSISAPGGRIQVIRPLTKNSEDGIVDMEGETVRFLSKVPTGTDGVFLRVFPASFDQPLIFRTNEGLEVRTNMNFFLSNKTAVSMLAEGKAVSFTKEMLELNKGSLQLQFDRMISQRVTECMKTSDERTCREKIGKETRGLKGILQRAKLSQLWQDRNAAKSGTGSVLGLHPDFLLFMGSEDLYNLDSKVVKEVSLASLSDISKALYNKLISTAPEKFASLPLRLQEKAMLLEGSLPEDIRKKAALTETEFQSWKQVLLSMGELQRVEIAAKLRLLPSEILSSIKSLNQGKARKVLERLLMIPDNKLNEATLLYLDQLDTVETLQKKFAQVKQSFSNEEIVMLEKILTLLEDNFMYESPLAPVVYKKLDTLFSSVGVLTRDSLLAQVKAIRADVDSSISASQKSRYSANLGSFTDVNDSSWEGYFVLKAKSLGAIDGYKTKDNVVTGAFGPNNDVLVGELLKIALELSDNGTSDKVPTLTSAKTHWAKGYAARAEELKLSIVQDTKLDLNRQATRAEVIQTLLESFSMSPDLITKSSFADVSPFANYARFVEFARKLGIVSGDDGKNTFRPLDKISRAETAKMAATVVYYLKTPLQMSDVSGDLGE